MRELLETVTADWPLGLNSTAVMFSSNGKGLTNGGGPGICQSRTRGSDERVRNCWPSGRNKATSGNFPSSIGSARSWPFSVFQSRALLSSHTERRLDPSRLRTAELTRARCLNSESKVPERASHRRATPSSQAVMTCRPSAANCAEGTRAAWRNRTLASPVPADAPGESGITSQIRAVSSSEPVRRCRALGLN